ncbi:hypothetical protein [Pontixanthobacter luteolus]|uniref:hypothetical protein n=1 Tax=Pontixanthobacter luteolus TaxID=295089 RepID=UPI002303B24F|nr:hypothetical protein [Pontixanthobacter luteolus]
MAELVFLAASLLVLLILGYVFWGGVGSKRRDIGRGFAVAAFGLAAYVGHMLYDKLT